MALLTENSFNNILSNKVILVTGGTGSMGKVLIKRILTGELGLVKKIVILSRDEAKHYEMKTGDFKEFNHRIEYRIGDIRNYEDVYSAMEGVNIVINAAALKQVPSCEYYPEQAIETNCKGPINIVNASKRLNVELVVGISTDKACKPVNVMGMTKALQEKIFINGNLQSRTKFVVVRYGNVLASRGSVIPLFLDQVKRKRDITITDERMTRFLLSLDDAVDTVFVAIQYGYAGDTIIPIVPSAKVKDIAFVIRNNQPKYPESSNNIITTGIRPGEKIHEILISEEEVSRTFKFPGINYYVIKSSLPELSSSSDAKTLVNEYSSEHNVINKEDLYLLLKKNNLLNYDLEGEILR